MSRLFTPLPVMSSNSPPRSSSPYPLSSSITKKKRGGRQLRQVILSPDLKFSIRQFAISVGTPRLMEPTGFRDFRGWLERVSGPSASDAWDQLIHAMILETKADRYRILFIKEEVVREIVRAIVVPRPGESAKLVSTNCGRQCARPKSGNTLMTILERILVQKRILTQAQIEMFINERNSPQGLSLFREMAAMSATQSTQSHLPTTHRSTGPSHTTSPTAMIPSNLNHLYTPERSPMSLHTITATIAPQTTVNNVNLFQPYASNSSSHTVMPEIRGVDVSSRVNREIGFQPSQQMSTNSYTVPSHSSPYLTHGLRERAIPFGRGRANQQGIVETIAQVPHQTVPRGTSDEGRLPSFRELEESLDERRR